MTSSTIAIIITVITMILFFINNSITFNRQV